MAIMVKIMSMPPPPVILGKDGVEAIIELPMTDKEQELFHKSCELIRSYMAKAEEI